MGAWLKRGAMIAGVLVVGGASAMACSNKAEQQLQEQQSGSSNLGASANIKELMAARNLSEADVEAALKTFTPTGKKDEYMIFASGGQSGQVLVIGVPSMRLLKQIAVYTPEPWQGYGYGGESDKVLAGGQQYPSTSSPGPTSTTLPCRRPRATTTDRSSS